MIKPHSQAFSDRESPIKLHLRCIEAFRGTKLAMLLLATVALAAPVSRGQSQWVHFGSEGRLQYARTPKGDQVPDFSSAGYHGGGVALPNVIVRVKVSPTGGPDDATAIQAALDQVARLAPGANGQRGAVELAPGTFRLANPLMMRVSGVVLRGASSSGANATVLEMVGPPHLAIQMNGEFHKQVLSSGTPISNAYIPAGTREIQVANASEIHAGDTIEIVKPVTKEWTHFMGMDHLWRDGKPEVWVQNDIRVRRRVTSVSEPIITLQVPLTDSLDARFYQGQPAEVTRVKVTGQIAELGVENLRIVSPVRTINYRKDPEFDGIVINNVVDSWLRSVAFEDTTNSVRIDQGAERLTVVDVNVLEHKAVRSNAKPFGFWINGSQILLDRCTGKGNNFWYIATQSRSEGPVVVLHCQFSGNGMIEGHQRWSTGLLVDSCVMPKGQINLRNRGELGSGHGWAIGWSVLWNDKARQFVVQNPPGALNWSIGSIGKSKREPMPVFEKFVGPVLPSGIVESIGRQVKPDSLYLEQLRERMGPEALTAIGYH